VIDDNLDKTNTRRYRAALVFTIPCSVVRISHITVLDSIEIPKLLDPSSRNTQCIEGELRYSPVVSFG
jgi:hypothetical protein